MSRQASTADPLTDVITKAGGPIAPSGEGWWNAYVNWRVAHGDELGAVAAGAPNDDLLELTYELLESAVQAGWEAAAAMEAAPDRAASG